MIELKKDNIETLAELLNNYDFEDMFFKLDDDKPIIHLSKKWKIYLRITFNESFENDFKNSNFYQDKFSYSVKWWKNIFFRVAKNWERFTIRKLWYTFDFYENYRTDPVLFWFISNVLLQKYNKTLLISWRTWSWKTTFILSLLNMLNVYDFNKVVSKQLLKALNSMLKAKNIEIKITTENLNNIIQDYLTEEETIQLQEIVWWLLDKIKIKELLDNYYWATVYSIEKPIEYFFEEDTNLYFNQNEIDSTTAEIANENYIRLVDIALQSNPNIVYISEIKNKIEYERFLDTVYVWPSIIASNHANNVFQNLKRIESISTNISEIKSKITMWVWGLINLERYEVIWDQIYLSSYEILKMYENSVKWSYFANEDAVFQSQMLIEYKKENYYISHELSLLYNMYLNYLRWKSFVLKNIKKQKMLSLLTEHRQQLENLYWVWENGLVFLEETIIENYSKFEDEILF